MYRLEAVHSVAAAGKRDPQLLSDLDEALVGHVVDGGDPVEVDEVAVRGGGDGVQIVSFLHLVHRPPIRGPDTIVAGAGEGDAHGGAAGDLLGGRGGGINVVGSVEGEEGLDLEEVFDGLVGRLVLRHIAGQRLALELLPGAAIVAGSLGGAAGNQE